MQALVAARELRQAMGELPSEQREILVGAYDRGRSLSELAEEKGLPLGTVMYLRVSVSERRLVPSKRVAVQRRIG